MMSTKDGVGSTGALVRRERQGVSWWTDEELAKAGVLLAFTERLGGVSVGPYASLNLAGHVGDDPRAVDENRERLLDALGLGPLRSRLTTAEQVHGDGIAVIGEGDARPGSGAFADSTRPRCTPPVPRTDALLVCEPKAPLLLCFADCVPVILVVTKDDAPAGPAAGVVHAGWAGALAGLPGLAVSRLAQLSGCDPSRIRAYVGAHIGPCHYRVGAEIMSQFVNTFGTVARAESGGLDLGAAVSASLTDAGVDPCSITSLGTCTAEATDRFFSYRAEGGLTGRHGAFVCILPG